MNVTIVIPTYNGGTVWQDAANQIAMMAKGMAKVIVIDSGSKDSTCEVAIAHSFDLHTITSLDFNHGGTRNKGVELSSSDIVVFLTQDAIPENNAISKIINVFSNADVVAAYGRQLPHHDANPIATHARIFNYKENGYISDLDSIKEMGIKTVFMSNSFSAYRVSAFKILGGFPNSTILAEDMFLAAKAVLAGYKIAYVADANVRHSHNYTPVEEFKRYFDIGVFHSDESWIRESFGGAGGEGKKFIFSEMLFLLKNAPLWIPVACVNNFSKIIGYKLGQNYRRIPAGLRRKLSMHKRYWDGISD
ncbi:glycosyltransferase family 2 protein [Edaphovirga cremea]|uniref:glycosyltransferase family 2 protein n=1 Tax=Edaphovirga cremea TaxID=2267246 RepID=UPI000DEF85BA|nr:glycosyltransferase [Edaphovirga cremea]